MNRGFLPQDEIDKFESVIWTERYYGDSEVELITAATPDMIKKLPEGIFLGLKGSKEVMLLDTVDIEKGALKLTGAGLVPWLNNRFIRVTAAHADQYWNMEGLTPGHAIAFAVEWMCIDGPFMAGSWDMGIPNPQQLVVPGLSIGGYDDSGAIVPLAVPYGPVYDAIRAIGTTYEIGMRITLESANDAGYSLQFRSYKGIDRTTDQSVYPPVRFSPQMDTLTDIAEVQSIASYKNVAYSFASAIDPTLNLTGAPGSNSSPGTATGFDLRAVMTFESDITTDLVNSDPNALLNLLNARAALALNNNRSIQTVDGQIVSLHQFQYGADYTLGDIIEVQGNSDVVQKSRVTEYIRSQDSTGEKAYPTVAMLS
jgi:hypothetical protein